MMTPTTAPAAARQQQAGDTTPALSVWVPGTPVSTNRLWRKGRSGRLYLSAAAREWEEAVATEVFATINAARFPEPVAHPEAWARPFRVRLTFSLARSGDVDNYAKATLDGLKRGLCVDDRHFGTVEASLNEHPARANGRRVTGCQIEVWPAPEPVIALDASGDDEEDVTSLLPIDRPRAVLLPGGLTIAILLPDTAVVPASESEVKAIPTVYLPLGDARDLYTSLAGIPTVTGHTKRSA